jgi:hypothetical protein
MDLNTTTAVWTYEQLTQQLETMRGEEYLGKARSLFTIDMAVQPWAESFVTSTETTPPMEAEIINYHSVLPNVLRFHKRSLSSPVIALGDAAIFNVHLASTAQSQGYPLSDRILRNIVTAIHRKEDKIVFRGDSSGVYGIGNHPQIAQVLLAANGSSNGWTAATTWLGKTIDQILSELGEILRLQSELAEEMGAPMVDTLVLPTTVITSLKTRLTAANNQSMWSLLVETFPNLTFTSTSLMNSLPISSIGGNSTAALLYNRAQSLSVVIPRDVTIEPTQARDLELVTPAHSRFGGVRVFYPESVQLLVGI